jgi:hypothetical protein
MTPPGIALGVPYPEQHRLKTDMAVVIARAIKRQDLTKRCCRRKAWYIHLWERQATYRLSGASGYLTSETVLWRQAGLDRRIIVEIFDDGPSPDLLLL